MPRRKTFSVRSNVAPGRQLNDIDEVALILSRDKPGRNSAKTDYREGKQPGVNDEHDRAAAKQEAIPTLVADQLLRP